MQKKKKIYPCDKRTLNFTWSVLFHIYKSFKGKGSPNANRMVVCSYVLSNIGFVTRTYLTSYPSYYDIGNTQKFIQFDSIRVCSIQKQKEFNI